MGGNSVMSRGSLYGVTPINSIYFMQPERSGLSGTQTKYILASSTKDAGGKAKTPRAIRTEKRTTVGSEAIYDQYTRHVSELLTVKMGA